MRETRIACYIGDHPLDMNGAKAARVRGIDVLTGFHSEAELREAGADTISSDLTQFSRDLIDGNLHTGRGTGRGALAAQTGLQRPGRIAT